MIRGLIIGKFLPPHLGHLALINFALERCDELTIIGCHNASYSTPGVLHKVWLVEIHPTSKVIFTDEK